MVGTRQPWLASQIWCVPQRSSEGVVAYVNTSNVYVYLQYTTATDLPDGPLTTYPENRQSGLCSR